MPDINQALANEGRLLDPQGNIVGDPDWTEQTAAELAEQEGITLGSEHWEVIQYVRNYYHECGRPSSGASLLRCLEDHFVQRGGRKHLYQLFPGGPVTQATRFGGLTAPPYSHDPSFGSVQ
jgi:tRNA 2-thiouridine synthesizing protein E